MINLKRSLFGLELLLVCLIGLHIPRSFTLFYVFLLIIVLRSARGPLLPRRLRWCIGCIAVFSVSYVLISYSNASLTLSGSDFLDAMSMLILPVASTWVGARASFKYGIKGLGVALYVYASSAAIYAVATLLISRVAIQGLGLSGLMPSLAPVYSIYSSGELINARSVEQNSSIAASYLLPSLVLFFRKHRTSWRVLAGAFVFLGFAGLLSGIAFDGRLVLFSAVLYWVIVMMNWASAVQGFNAPMARKTGSLLIAATLVTMVSLAVYGKLEPSNLYDERLGIFQGFLRATELFPYGGDLMKFTWYNHLSGEHFLFDASRGDMVHNVLFDVYVRAGYVPALALGFGVAPLLYLILSGLQREIRCRPWAVPELLGLGFVVCLSVQWLFQPLQYSDGIFFFVGFLVLGFLAGWFHQSHACPAP